MVIALCRCEKEDPKLVIPPTSPTTPTTPEVPACEKNNSGYITLNNITSCDYLVSVSIEGGDYIYVATANQNATNRIIEMSAGKTLSFKASPKNDNTYPEITWSPFILSQCTEKELYISDKREDCYKKNIGYLTLENNSSDPFNVYIDNLPAWRMEGKTTKTIELSTGSHSIKVLQISGYWFYPTAHDHTATIKACRESTFKFQ